MFKFKQTTCAILGSFQHTHIGYSSLFRIYRDHFLQPNSSTMGSLQKRLCYQCLGLLSVIFATERHSSSISEKFGQTLSTGTSYCRDINECRYYKITTAKDITKKSNAQTCKYDKRDTADKKCDTKNRNHCSASHGIREEFQQK